MLARLLYVLVILLGLPAWVVGLAAPLAWLAGAAVLQIVEPAPAPALTWRWLGRLHASSLVLMLLASMVAMLIAGLAAFAFARVGRRAALWCSAAVLVIPPLVYGYLWYLVWSRSVSLLGLPTPYNLPAPALGNLSMAAWAIGLWLWPIPAVLLSVGWQWTGRPAWTLARLDGSDAAAFVRAALPAMRGHLLAALAISLVLVSQEYAVPALFSVQVWQTQWLALAQAGEPLGRLALGALPAGLVLLALLGTAAVLWRSAEAQGTIDFGQSPIRSGARAMAGALLAGVLIGTIVLPAAWSARTLTRGLTVSLGRFQAEFMDTALLMATTATIAVAAGLSVVTAGASRRSRLLRILPGLLLAGWVLPVSLLAEAARQAQLHLGLIGRAMSLLVWVSILAGRMLPIAWIVLAATARSLPEHLSEQAALDGASRPRFAVSVAWPLLAPAILAAWLICALLTATETAAATMLQLPGFDVLAVSLLNQMHYGRDADVIAVCLLMVGVAAMCAGVIGVALGRATERRDRD